MAVSLAWLQAEFTQLEDFHALAPGGQKEVFRARDKATGELVVLKLFHATANPERALRELQAVSGLEGNRVPRIIQFGSARSNVGDHIFFIEQFIEGETLKDYLGIRDPVPADVLRWAEQVLSTLAAAEAAEIVHRDIKPANIIIDTNSDAWLIDFGIARHLALESVTPTSALVGPHSPGYAPPEQFANSKHEVGTRADLFALGVVMFECLEGRNPFVDGAANCDEILSRVASTDLPRLTERSGIPSAVVDLVQSMTRRPLSQRPSSAEDALRWLQGF